MNDKITSIAAALVAKAGTNASAGIGALNDEDSVGIDGTRKRATSCMHHAHSNNGTLERSETGAKHNRGQSCGGGAASGVCEYKHQIGINLADLSVCLHKSTWPDQCFKCGEPYYASNQYSCDNCKSDESPIAGTLRSDFYKNLNNPTLKKFQTSNITDMYNSSTLLSIIETNNNNIQLITDEDDSHTASKNSTLLQQLPLVEYLTRKNFEDEFSSLIINSTCSSTHFVTSFVSDDNEKKPIQPENHTLTNRDLVEQIKLYNKYNNSKLTDLKYEFKEEDTLLVTGPLKIHWNLKEPIQLSTAFSNDDLNDQSLKSEQQTHFKATLLKDSNQKKTTSYDDSSLSKKNKLKESQTGSGRAQTVNYKPNKWKRPGLNINDSKEKESQNFIPAYSSVSSIRIDSQITCLKAIQILLDKYHISNPSSRYSLYKCYQSGETRELDDDSFPLIERIWMGPFSEDKMFIMEKGRQLNNNQEVSNLMCLPESLLQNLLENLIQEERKEIENMTRLLRKYQEILQTIRLETMEPFEKDDEASVAEEITTSCRM